MKRMASMLAASLAMAAWVPAVLADTETTTTTRVETTTTVPTLVLPSGFTYMVVDPATGVVVGPYDMATRLINGRALTPGYYVFQENTGKVMATVDGAGNLIAFTGAPTVLPPHFLLENGQLVFFTNDFAYRRAQIDQKIALDYSGGRLTNHQVKELREDLAEIAELETHRKSDGTFSASRMRQIERRFADVQADMARYLADTSNKRAKIGLRVD